MARPRKQTVDYFPHYCQHKKTMFILEQRYGNDGYAFWFKLLELLGETKGHYLDLNDSIMSEFLQAKTHLDEGFCNEILELLAKVDAIDAELWSKGVVWSQNFVDGIEPVYRNRRMSVPQKPSFYIDKPEADVVSTVETLADEGSYVLPTEENPQSRVEKSRVEKSRDICAPDGAHAYTAPSPGGSVEAEKVTATPDGDKLSEKSGPRSPFKSKRQEQLFDEFWAQYPKKRSKGQAEKTWVKLKPDEQLFEAIMAGLERAKTSVDWQKDSGQYIPYPATWLNAKGWEDEYPQQGGGTSGRDHVNRGNTPEQHTGSEPNSGFKKFQIPNVTTGGEDQGL